MKNKTCIHSFIILLVLLFAISCYGSDKLFIIHEQVGPLGTNCYLIFDAETREAALIDVAGPIHKLESAINEKELTLKYIFLTHGHHDHIQGVPEIRQKYPLAKVCLSRQEKEDMPLYSRWEDAYKPEQLAAIKKNHEMVNTFNFDYRLIGSPDILLEDGQTYKLGNIDIKTELSPGHSRGSICLHVDHALFSGDVLFYRSIGRTFGTGQDQLMASVGRLFEHLPDATKVYPGHGPFTDIGSEKRHNTYYKSH